MSPTSLNLGFFIEYYVPDFNSRIPYIRQFSLDEYDKLEITFHIKVGHSIFKHQVSIVLDEDDVSREAPIVRIAVKRRPASCGDSSDDGEKPENSVLSTVPVTLVTVHATDHHHHNDCEHHHHNVCGHHHHHHNVREHHHHHDCDHHHHNVYEQSEHSRPYNFEDSKSTDGIPKENTPSVSPTESCVHSEKSIPESESESYAGNSSSHKYHPSSSPSFVPSSTRFPSPSSTYIRRYQVVESNPNESSGQLITVPSCNNPTNCSTRIQGTDSLQICTFNINRTDSSSPPSNHADEDRRRVHPSSD